MILALLILLLILVCLTGYLYYSKPQSNYNLFRKISVDSIEGLIVHGLGRARKDLGYPTANLRINPEDYPKTVKLKCGIYLLDCQIPGYSKIMKGYARLNMDKSHFFIYLPDLHYQQQKVDLYDKKIKLRNFELVSARWLDFIQVYHNFLDLIHGYPYIKSSYF